MCTVLVTGLSQKTGAFKSVPYTLIGLEVES